LRKIGTSHASRRTVPIRGIFKGKRYKLRKYVKNGLSNIVLEGALFGTALGEVGTSDASGRTVPVQGRFQVRTIYRFRKYNFKKVCLIM